MSREINLPTCKTIIFFLILLSPVVLLASAVEKSRLITKEVNVDEQMLVEVWHERGQLDVEYYQGSKAILTVNMIARGDVEEDLDVLLSKYSLDVNTDGQTVFIESNTNIKNWNQVSAILYKRTKIRFKDGSVINSKIDDLKVNFNLKIPRIKKLDLTNKYHDINVSNVPFDLSVTQFSSGIDIGDVAGNFTLHMKYGKGTVGEVQNADLELFDSKLRMKDIEYLKVSDKYSDLVFGNAGNADMRLFDADVEMGNVRQKCDIRDKYSKISLGTIESGVWDLFDAKIDIESAKELDIKSKYTELEISSLDKLQLTSFDDNFIVTSLGFIVSEESKYTKYEIGTLQESATFNQSFDDKFEVLNVGSAFKGFSMDSKYTKVALPIPSGIKYHLETDCKYGKIEYPQDAFETKVYIERDSELKIKGSMRGATDQSPLVKISGFDNKVNLN